MGQTNQHRSPEISAITNRKIEQPDSDVPPQWEDNPSSWSQRLPIAVLSGLVLALYQWDLFATVWEPFFGAGSRTILNSEVFASPANSRCRPRSVWLSARCRDSRHRRKVTLANNALDSHSVRACGRPFGRGEHSLGDSAAGILRFLVYPLLDFGAHLAADDRSG
jgi:hypothetical protein